jgi:hypothetical protein
MIGVVRDFIRYVADGGNHRVVIVTALSDLLVSDVWCPCLARLPCARPLKSRGTEGASKQRKARVVYHW